MKILISCALAVLLSFVSGSSLAQVEVFDDQTNFVNATGAIQIPIPSAAIAFPGAAVNSCGASEIGSTAESRLERSTTAKIEINFGDGNKITLTQDLTLPGNNSVGLCVLDDTHIRTLGNTNPNVMIANTIVGNGEDDYLITFDNPVQAVGFRLLTNSSAVETVVLKDATATVIPSGPVDGFTAPNTRQFVGFKSLTPVKSVLINTSGGAFQNEGIDEIKIAERFQVDIDIKPGSDPNCFNINGHGVIPVAILGSSTFDVMLVNLSSLSFGGLEVRVRGNRGPLCNFEDSDGDTILDLVCHFEDDAGSWTPGGGDATLSGELFDGTKFEGTDSICVTQEVPQ
jgi:hypothetical protein